MKKLLYLLLLTPIIYLSSCSKSGVTPQVETNIEEIIVGKIWKLLDTDDGWFRLNNDNTYSTKDYLCDTLSHDGTWELEEDILIFTYMLGPLEYIESNTIIEFNDSIVKIQADTSANLDINFVFEITEAVIRGCMDSTYLNFNPNAQCSDTCINTPVYGCMDPNALNYNDNANIEDGSCCYVAGCMDPNALNYNANACQDDGNCCFIEGCTDLTALNYNANACQDDGTCCFIEGCMDSTSLNYAPNACLDNGSCCYVAGCMDNTSPNYDPNACIDDGSCLSIGDTYQGGIIFYFDGNGGGLIAASQDQGTFNFDLCFEYDPISETTVSIIQNNANDFGVGSGMQNTINIVSACIGANGTAASTCYDLNYNGYSDWFLPSANELSLMYFNIGPGSSFSNNIGNFMTLSNTNSKYWSSTITIQNGAYWMDFSSSLGTLYPGNGIHDVNNNWPLNIRAIRSF